MPPKCGVGLGLFRVVQWVFVIGKGALLQVVNGLVREQTKEIRFRDCFLSYLMLWGEGKGRVGDIGMTG